MIRPIAARCALCTRHCRPRSAEDQFFDSNGVKIHYVVEGRGGARDSGTRFHRQHSRAMGDARRRFKLAKNYQVIALDNRGHGKSAKPHDPKQYGPEMVETSST